LPTPRVSPDVSSKPMQDMMTQYLEYKRKQEEAHISRMAEIVTKTEERKVNRKKGCSCCLL
jgi:hypothetical protein